jgi:hypothetical protein
MQISPLVYDIDYNDSLSVTSLPPHCTKTCANSSSTFNPYVSPILSHKPYHIDHKPYPIFVYFKNITKIKPNLIFILFLTPKKRTNPLQMEVLAHQYWSQHSLISNFKGRAIFSLFLETKPFSGLASSIQCAIPIKNFMPTMKFPPHGQKYHHYIERHQWYNIIRTNPLGILAWLSYQQ